MSSTRYSADAGAFNAERFMSDPALLEARGLPGLPVAAKAALLQSPRKRSLLYFLQALSIRLGGLNHVGEDFLATFPERIGTRTMHAEGIKPGTCYPSPAACAIECEIDPRGAANRALLRHSRDEEGQPPDPRDEPESSTDRLLAECWRQAREQMADRLRDLCIDPQVNLRLPGENEAEGARENRELMGTGETGCVRTISYLKASWFHDLPGALLEYQARHASRAAGEFVATSISKVVFEALDYCLRTRQMVLLEGNSGVGKTESVKAWAAQHLGEVRHVSLSGICNRTSFFRDLARTLGVGVGAGYSAAKTQARVEDFLERSRLMLVLDECQYLLGQQERINKHPELVNWLLTACYNRGVPVALVGTKDFSRRRQAVERQTTWSSEQLARRTNRVFELPARPTQEDLEAVARKLLPAAGKISIDYLVGYAIQSRRFLPALGEVIADAQMLAEAGGRGAITYADLKRAITDIRGPSDAAQRRVFEEDPAPRRGSPTGKAQAAASALPAPDRCNVPATLLPVPERANDFTGERPDAAAQPAPPNRLRFVEPVPA